MNGGTQTSTTGAPPSWVQDNAADYLGKATDIANRGYSPSPSQAIGPNSYQQTAWNATQNRAMGGSPVMGAANQSLMDTMQGKYLDSNPYLDGMIDKAQGDVVRNYNDVIRPGQDASMIRSGSFGNSGLQQQTQNQDRSLQDSLGNISTQMRGQNYANERQNMQNAFGYAPQFANQDYTDIQQLMNAGNQQGLFAQGQANQNYAWWNEANQAPVNDLNVQGNALGNVMGNSGKSTTTPGTSTAAGIAGGALTAAQLGQLLGLFGKP